MQSSLIDIKVETSRSQPTVGILGISARITNISNSTIYLRAKDMDLVLPPELEVSRADVNSRWAFFPTEKLPADDPWEVSIILSPGDSYPVFWRTDPNFGLEPDATSQDVIKTQSNAASGGQRISDTFKIIGDEIASEMRFLFFPPGDYNVTVVAKYRTTSEESANSTYRTVAATSTIHVVAPPFVILFGAALGGVLAYFIVPGLRKHLSYSPTKFRGWVARFAKEAGGISGSALLSAVVTILLSRISESQFLIQVTVTDFWGAIAIGFVANYLGWNVLGKIVSRIGPAQDHGTQDHGTQDHGTQDHGTQDHGTQDHGTQDHGTQDHAAQDHGAQDHGKKAISAGSDPSKETTPKK